MVITNIVPSRISHELAALAHHASGIPGCKVKQSHLLEAVSKIEGKKNWQSFESEISKKLYTHDYERKHVEILYIDGELRVQGVIIDVCVRGYRGNNIRVYASFNPSDDYWVNECVPSFEGYSLDGTVSVEQAMDSFKIALNEVAEICSWINRDKKKLTLGDFSCGWTIDVSSNQPLSEDVLVELYRLGFVEQQNKRAKIGLSEYIEKSAPVEFEILCADPDGSDVIESLGVWQYSSSYVLTRLLLRYREKYADKRVYYRLVK